MQERQVTDILITNVNKAVFSDTVFCNNGKDRQYICRLSSSWRNNHTTFSQDNKNIFSYDVSQYNKNSAYTMSLMWFRFSSGSFTTETSGMRLSYSYWQSWQWKEKVKICIVSWKDGKDGRLHLYINRLKTIIHS